MLNSVALFGGFTLVLSAALSASGQEAAVKHSSADRNPSIQTVPAGGRIAYLSAPMALSGQEGVGSNMTPIPTGNETRWQVVFEGNVRETETGSPEALLEAVRLQRPIAVRVPTFHGFIMTQCLDAYETTDGDVGCEVEFWCDGPSQAMIPAHHKHIALVRSNGEVQQAVAVHNERDEERIVQVGFTTDSLTWFTE